MPKCEEKQNKGNQQHLPFGAQVWTLGVSLAYILFVVRVVGLHSIRAVFCWVTLYSCCWAYFLFMSLAYILFFVLGMRTSQGPQF